MAVESGPTDFRPVAISLPRVALGRLRRTGCGLPRDVVLIVTAFLVISGDRSSSATEDTPATKSKSQTEKTPTDSSPAKNSKPAPNADDRKRFQPYGYIPHEHVVTISGQTLNEEGEPVAG